VAWGVTGDEIETGTRFFSALWSKNKRLRGQGLWVGGGKEWAEAAGRQNIITNNSNFSGAGRKGGKEKHRTRGVNSCQGKSEITLSSYHTCEAWLLLPVPLSGGNRPQETWMAQATLLSPWLRRLELNATINSEVVIASENVAEMCATKNKSCAMLHHTHDVTQGISSDVAKSGEVKWHCTDPTEVRTFAPWATGSFEDGHHGTYGYNACRTSIWPRPINQGQDFIDLGIVQIAELFTLPCDQTPISVRQS